MVGSVGTVKIGVSWHNNAVRRVIQFTYYRFDSQNLGGLLMSEQFAQLSTALPSKYIYGLEQRTNSFPLDTNWNTVTMFNHDAAPHKVIGATDRARNYCSPRNCGEMLHYRFFRRPTGTARIRPTSVWKAMARRTLSISHHFRPQVKPQIYGSDEDGSVYSLLTPLAFQSSSNLRRH